MTTDRIKAIPGSLSALCLLAMLPITAHASCGRSDPTGDSDFVAEKSWPMHSDLKIKARASLQAGLDPDCDFGIYDLHVELVKRQTNQLLAYVCQGSMEIGSAFMEVAFADECQDSFRREESTISLAESKHEGLRDLIVTSRQSAGRSMLADGDCVDLTENQKVTKRTWVFGGSVYEQSPMTGASRTSASRLVGRSSPSK